MATLASAGWSDGTMLGDKGGGGGVGGRVGLLNLLHEEHAPDTEKRRQRVCHGDDGGSSGEPRPEAVEGVEDKGSGGDRRVIVGEGVDELLLVMEVGGDGLIPLDKLTKVIVEVDRFAGLVHREELEGGEPELARHLILGEDHVGDVLVDGRVEDIEDSVVSGRPFEVGRGAAMVPSK
jgi:hypothetical protein